jgi:hypothetical protein
MKKGRRKAASKESKNIVSTPLWISHFRATSASCGSSLRFTFIKLHYLFYILFSLQRISFIFQYRARRQGARVGVHLTAFQAKRKPCTFVNNGIPERKSSC